VLATSPVTAAGRRAREPGPRGVLVPRVATIGRSCGSFAAHWGRLRPTLGSPHRRPERPHGLARMPTVRLPVAGLDRRPRPRGRV